MCWFDRCISHPLLKTRKKKTWFSSISCAYVHAPLLLQACHRLVHWRYNNAGKSGRREHEKARQQCIVPMTLCEPRERTRRTKDETGPVTLAQKCLRYKNKKKTLQYLGHMGKLCWLLWEEHSTSSLPSLLSSRTPLKTTWDQLVMCSNNKEKTLTALKKRS